MSDILFGCIWLVLFAVNANTAYTARDHSPVLAVFVGGFSLLCLLASACYFSGAIS
jgi:hypothetical protein